MPPGFPSNFPEEPTKYRIPERFLSEKNQQRWRSWARKKKQPLSKLPRGSVWVTRLSHDELLSLAHFLGVPESHLPPDWSVPRLSLGICLHLYDGQPLPGHAKPAKPDPNDVPHQLRRRMTIRHYRYKQKERKRWDRRMWEMAPEERRRWEEMRAEHRRRYRMRQQVAAGRPTPK